MAGEIGTAKLLKVLEKAKRMTVEEYNDLYDRTLRDIAEIMENKTGFDVLINYGPVTQAELNDNYREPGEPVFQPLNTRPVYYFCRSSQFDAGETEMAEAA